MNPKLLDRVREEVLIIRALQDNPAYGSGFGLSSFCYRFPDENRGHIQRCLSLLAKEGVMYERQHAEGGVPPYGHCETDKSFQIRIARDEAIAKLDEMKVEWRKMIRNEVRDRNAWGNPTLFKRQW
jgi:hypothetical protein